MALLSLFVGCAPSLPPVGEADLILSGGRVLVGEAGSATPAALAVANGRIVALGDLTSMRSRKGSGTVVLELGGRTVLPAFVDHHVHLLNVGLSLLNQRQGGRLFVDLAGAASPEEIGQRLALRAAELEPGRWVLGKGWSQGGWGATALPDEAPLSAAVPDHPVYLTRVDGHAGWLNRAGLAAAGIGRETGEPPGGAILRRADGTPTGVLLERANELVLPLLPQPSDADVAAAFRLAAEALAAQGVVEVHDAGFLAMPGVVDLQADLEHWLRLLEAVDREAPLPLRVRLMVPAPSALADSVLADPGAYRSLSPRLGVTHLKLFADGALGSRGAALSRPFADDPTAAGVPRMSAEELTALSVQALDAGLGVAVHAIGDAALHRTLEVFEALLAADPELDPHRLRLEHVSFPQLDDVERAARLGILLSVQPNFVAPGDDGVAMEDQRIGPDGVERVYAWATLANAGGRLAFGSDFFTLLGDPLLTVYAAVTRRNTAGQPPGGWHPDQRLDRRFALTVGTRVGGASATDRPAGLRVGDAADLVVLSADPTAVADEELLAIGVDATVVSGRLTWRSEALAGPPGPKGGR